MAKSTVRLICSAVSRACAARLLVWAAAISAAILSRKMGRVVPARSLDEIIRAVKKHTGAKAAGVVGRQKRTVRKAAVCAGSCGKIINQVIAAGCDLYVTGELKHHHALAAQEAGVSCLCLSHSVSERFILKKLAKQLQKKLKDVKVIISRKDADPFIWKQI